MIQDLLHEWARWHRYHSGACKGYPPEAAFLGDLRGASIPTPKIEDDIACRVDSAVGKLKARKPTQANVLTMYYLKGLSISKISRKIRADRREVSSLLRRAEDGVEWILDPH